MRQALRRGQEGFPDLGQRGRGQIHSHALLDNPHGHHQRPRSLSLPGIRIGERWEETGRGHRAVFEKPGNRIKVRLLSTDAHYLSKNPDAI